jgi:hypothetical protein
LDQSSWEKIEVMLSVTHGDKYHSFRPDAKLEGMAEEPRTETIPWLAPAFYHKNGITYLRNQHQNIF